MEPTSLPTELILSHPQRSLGQVQLDWVPQPGAYLCHQGQTYTVLERRHHYQFQANRYHLHKIALYLQATAPPAEQSWVTHRWVIGDATCRYNAQSELMRCAVNPDGSCHGCRHYTPRQSDSPGPGQPA